MTMELSRETARQLSELIHRLCGLVLGHNKAYLIRHRLEPLVRREGLTGFDQLHEFLQSRGGSRLHAPIIEAITTKETSFFRDAAFFRAIETVVLPDCIARFRRSAGHRHRITIWSAACATGQEPYSVAMLVRDLVASDPRAPRESQFSILATDISAEAVATARAGRYHRGEIDRGLSAKQRERHFHPDGRTWAIDDSLRRLVHFRAADLLQPQGSPAAFDLILCRNALIYFDLPTRRRICKRFYSLLHPGGWLGLGAAESLFGIDDGFEPVKLGRAMFYRKPATA